MPSTPGIHHITAISGLPQETLDFYAQGLGLRLVKTTVNFDDPGTYHLYFGDATGQPGTILTFFPWTHAAAGQTGASMVHATAFTIPNNSMGYWTERLSSLNARQVAAPIERFGAPVVRFRDPHGLPLELVATSEASQSDGWTDGPVPLEHTIRAFHGATLAVDSIGPTAEVLMDLLGYNRVAEEDGRHRLQADGKRARTIDLVTSGMATRLGKGTVHHIAFRARDEKEQAVWQAELRDRGFHVTEVKDRQYFKSIYFREPGGVLFEIATDAPGFLRDESEEALGMALKLPPWLEAQREGIDSRLPPLRRAPSGTAT